MIRINLLPHREAKRKQKQAAFVAMLALGGLAGALVVLLVGGYNASRIAVQNERNLVLKTASAELDKKIGEIKTLKEEIESLKARQQAVEDLQGDRNQPVYLLDELVRQTPEGVHLKSFKQEGQRVTLSGYAQSQERVAELLRNVSGPSPWLERPSLTEVKVAPAGQNKAARKVVEFQLNVAIKRAREPEAEEAAGAKPPAGKVVAKAGTP
jgi:type IV pilus assembly protein PilN